MTATTRRAVSAHIRYQGRDYNTPRHMPTQLAENIRPMQQPAYRHRALAQAASGTICAAAVVLGALLIVVMIARIAGVL